MRTPYEMLIAKRLKIYIQNEGLNQAKLARKLGWSASDLSDVLRGRKPIGTRRKKHLMAVTGISLEPADYSERHYEYPPAFDRLINRMKESYRANKSEFESLALVILSVLPALVLMNRVLLLMYENILWDLVKEVGERMT